jgi:outer membrane immunogenic protein
MRKLVLAAAAMALNSTAYAADMPLLKAAPMAAPSWTGLYLGVNGGGEWGWTTTGTNDIAAINNGAVPFFSTLNALGVQNVGSNTFNTHGGLAGGQIGYLLQAGSVVAGLEVGMDWMNSNGSVAVGSVYPDPKAPGTFAFNQSSKADWLFTFLGRAGFDLGAWFPYVTVGLAVSDLSYTSLFTESRFPGGSALTITKTAVGIAGGGGIEWRWDNHWSIRGEYLFVGFNGLEQLAPVCTNAGGCAPGTASANFDNKAQFSMNIARAALSYKF